jgi:hypothetical protein
MGRRQRRREKSTKISSTETHAEAAFGDGGRYVYEVIPTPSLPEQDQAVAVGRIAGLGAERLRLVHALRNVDEQLRPRVRYAIAVGVPYRRIEELTGYSRSAISRWASVADDQGHEVTTT